MSDSWIDKEEKAVREDIMTIAKQETGLTNFKSTGVLRGFLEVIIKIVLFIYQTAINPIYRNASLDGATGIFLSMWGLMLGVVRKQEGKATGKFSGTAYGAGSIPAGSWVVVEGTDLRYKVIEDTAFGAGTSFLLSVIAEHAGSTYNIGSGTPVRITRSVSGLDTITVGEGWIETAGEESETDEPYRQRIKDRWRSQTLGDTKEVYRYYAASVPGVAAVQIVRTPRGPGSTDVIIAATTGVPSSALLTAVEEALYEHELMGFDVQVKPPNTIPIVLTISYSGEADTADVRLIAEQYIYGLSIGGRFAIRDLYARYTALNLSILEILSPIRDVQADDLSIITATITITKENA
jgi:uncharacterized phage protein gp47/JayE